MSGTEATPRAVRQERKGNVLHIVFDAPAARNAIAQPDMLALVDMLRDAAGNPDIRVVALRGAGGHFCGGGTIDSFGQVPDGEATLTQEERRARRIQRIAACAEISELLRTIPQPTLAILEGAAAGAGMIWAMACDLRIASETAFFSTAYGRMGVSGDMGAAAILLSVAGSHLVRRLLLLSERMEAPEMHSLGLLTDVLAPEAFAAGVRALLDQLADLPPLAVAAMKQNLIAAERQDWTAAVRLEAENMVRTLESRDCREAVLARKERRRPRFEGA